MKVIKRDGHMVDYCPEKIEIAIKKANSEVAEEDRVTDIQIRNIIKYIEKLAREDHNMVGKDEVPLFIVDEKENKDSDKKNR